MKRLQNQYQFNDLKFLKANGVNGSSFFDTEWEFFEKNQNTHISKYNL